MGMRNAVVAARCCLTLSCLLVAGCGTTVPGAATWPGAGLAAAALSASDFPPGVQYDLITEVPGQPDGAGAPGPMLSRPQGCSDALTKVIAKSAERGPGSAVKYAVGYDGARIMVTVLSWTLDLEQLRAEAARCAQFEAFFDLDSPGFPVTTTELAGLDPAALAYQQTLTLDQPPNSVFMAFQNVGGRAAFAIAYPGPNPGIDAKATLPQTFLDVFTQQIAKMRSS
jgi:hypothetical protein